MNCQISIWASASILPWTDVYKLCRKWSYKITKTFLEKKCQWWPVFNFWELLRASNLQFTGFWDRKPSPLASEHRKMTNDIFEMQISYNHFQSSTSWTLLNAWQWNWRKMGTLPKTWISETLPGIQSSVFFSLSGAWFSNHGGFKSVFSPRNFGEMIQMTSQVIGVLPPHPVAKVDFWILQLIAILSYEHGIHLIFL